MSGPFGKHVAVLIFAGIPPLLLYLLFRHLSAIIRKERRIQTAMQTIWPKKHSKDIEADHAFGVAAHGRHYGKGGDK